MLKSFSHVLLALLIVPTCIYADNPPSASPTPAIMDCNFKASPTTPLEKTLVLQWAEKATQQSFNFSSTDIDKQLANLKPCFTEQGWQSFNDALQKSGNLNTITTQKLTVTSTLNGAATISDEKNKQWTVTIPLQVSYKNDKEQLSQVLRVELLVGRKPSGDLGIMQMIASPLDNKTPAGK